MKPEIKQRIEQIRRGKVPEGYKKTKGGIIPDSWKISRVEDFCQMKSGNTITASEFDNNAEYPCYGGNGFRGYTSHYTHEGVHVLIGRQGALCGNVKLVKGKFFASEHAIVVTTKENSLMLFCFYLFEHLNLNKYSESSAQPGLSVEKILRIFVALPTISEQQKIATILSTQDIVIELYEKKIEQLQLLKKICLKKMFPKEGSSIPEVRFHGFTAPWEQRGLGEIASFSKGLGYSKNDIVSSGTPIILYGRLYTKYEMILKNVDTFVKAKPQSVYSHGGEVIIPASGETAEDISIAAVVKDKGVILGGDLNIVTPSNQIVSTFLALTITFGKAHKELSCFAQGKSVVHLHNSDLQKINILIPSIEEQKEISAFFLHLDNLITLQQQRRDEEKRKKKALMQLLLTGIVRV